MGLNKRFLTAPEFLFILYTVKRFLEGLLFSDSSSILFLYVLCGTLLLLLLFISTSLLKPVLHFPSLDSFLFLVYQEQHQSLNIYGRDHFKKYFSFPPNHV